MVSTVFRLFRNSHPSYRGFSLSDRMRVAGIQWNHDKQHILDLQINAINEFII